VRAVGVPGVRVTTVAHGQPCYDSASVAIAHPGVLSVAGAGPGCRGGQLGVHVVQAFSHRVNSRRLAPVMKCPELAFVDKDQSGCELHVIDSILAHLEGLSERHGKKRWAVVAVPVPRTRGSLE
jgi:hypothetical protein